MAPPPDPHKQLIADIAREEIGKDYRVAYKDSLHLVESMDSDINFRDPAERQKRLNMDIQELKALGLNDTQLKDLYQGLQTER